MMMKNSVATILLILFYNVTFSQTVTYEDFKNLLPDIEKEDYKTVSKKSKKILETTIDDSSDLRGIVTYMYLYSLAGMVTNSEIDFNDFQIKSKEYIGKRVVMNVNPCISAEENSLNSVKIHNKNGQQEVTKTTTNQKGVNILFFVNFEFNEKLNPEEFVGQNVRTGGILNEIEVNPNKSKIWIARLKIKDSFIRTVTAR